MQEEKEQKKEIRQLLFLLGSSVVVALLFSIFMINFYGTTGQYTVKNILLSPEMTTKLNYLDGTSGGKFTFDRITLRYFDDNDNEWRSAEVSTKEYRSIFEELGNLTSIVEPTQEVVGVFNTPKPATLTIYVKNDKTSKIFQEVVFVNEGDLFRVLLIEDQPKNQWAYFFHRKVYDHVVHIVAPEASP